jgi:hypothetical protein
VKYYFVDFRSRELHFSGEFRCSLVDLEALRLAATKIDVSFNGDLVNSSARTPVEGVVTVIGKKSPNVVLELKQISRKPLVELHQHEKPALHFLP